MIMFIFFRFELFLTLKFMFLTFLFGWALFQVISLQFHSMLVKDYNVKKNSFMIETISSRNKTFYSQTTNIIYKY